VAEALERSLDALPGWWPWLLRFEAEALSGSPVGARIRIPVPWSLRIELELRDVRRPDGPGVITGDIEGTAAVTVEPAVTGSHPALVRAGTPAPAAPCRQRGGPERLPPSCTTASSTPRSSSSPTGIDQEVGGGAVGFPPRRGVSPVRCTFAVSSLRLRPGTAAHVVGGRDLRSTARRRIRGTTPLSSTPATTTAREVAATFHDRRSTRCSRASVDPAAGLDHRRGRSPA
jgi:hypothetical protein